MAKLNDELKRRADEFLESLSEAEKQALDDGTAEIVIRD